MKDSAGIKRDNKAQIRKLLVCGNLTPNSKSLCKPGLVWLAATLT